MLKGFISPAFLFCLEIPLQKMIYKEYWYITHIILYVWTHIKGPILCNVFLTVLSLTVFLQQCFLIIIYCVSVACQWNPQWTPQNSLTGYRRKNQNDVFWIFLKFSGWLIMQGYFTGVRDGKKIRKWT